MSFMASYPVSGVTCEKVQRGVPGKHCGVLHYLLLVMLVMRTFFLKKLIVFDCGVFIYLFITTDIFYMDDFVTSINMTFDRQVAKFRVCQRRIYG